MSIDNDTPFDAPDLKAALRRTIGAETAPQALRLRILRALETAPQAAPAERMRIVDALPQATRASTPFRLPFGPLFGLAAAAIVLIALGGVAMRLQRMSDPAERGNYVQLSAPLADALVQRHDACCKMANHQHLNNIPRERYDLIGAALEQQLHHPVLLANLKRDGWKFHGAAVCPVNGVGAAHLVYSKGDQTVSVLSLPLSAAPGTHDGERFEWSSNNHSIAGFTDRGSFLCLVSYSPPQNTITAADLNRLLDEHSGDIVARATPPVTSPVAPPGTPRAEPRVTVTELIH